MFQAGRRPRLDRVESLEHKWKDKVARDRPGRQRTASAGNFYGEEQGACEGRVTVYKGAWRGCLGGCDISKPHYLICSKADEICFRHDGSEELSE